MPAHSLAHYNAVIIDHLKIIEHSEQIAQKAYQDILLIDQAKKNMPRTIEYLHSIYTSQMKVKQHAQDNLIESLEIIERIRQRRKRMIEAAKRECRLTYGIN